jgi:hypothetical protein
MGYAWRRWGDYQSAQALWNLFDAKTLLSAIVSFIGMIFFGASNHAWSAPGVVLAALAAAAFVSIIVLVLKIIISRPKTKNPVERNVQIILQNPTRDVGLSEATAFLCLRIWGKRFIDAAGTSGVDAASKYDEILQAAADGRLPIWGKRMKHGVFEPIPREYWFDNRFDWFSLLRNDANSESSKHTFSGDKYLSLMTSRSAIEKMS